MDQQNKELKMENSELQTNFDIMFQRFQNAKNQDKEECVSNQNALIASIEQKYQVQVQELNEKHNLEVFELQERYNKLERDLRSTNDKMIAEHENKANAQANYDKAKLDYENKKRKLEREIELMKEEFDFRILENKETLEKEKDKWKSKCAELEIKVREVESRRTAVIFDHEKERTRWNLEKEHLINQKNDILENVDKLEKKRETLLRENERLKNENKKNRRLLGNPGSGLGLCSLVGGGGGYWGMNNSKYAERSFLKEDSG